MEEYGMKDAYAELTSCMVLQVHVCTGHAPRTISFTQVGSASTSSTYSGRFLGSMLETALESRLTVRAEQEEKSVEKHLFVEL